MTLGNMRSLGVSSLHVWCPCGRFSTVSAEGLDDALAVPSLRARLTCTACKGRPNDVRPAWIEMRAPGKGRG
jgi:hypothetical protein